MENKMASQKWRKPSKQGAGHYEKRSALPATGWKNMPLDTLQNS
jgi:hypothetical protein